MFLTQGSETKRMNVDPIRGLRETRDIEYVADGHPLHRLDVLAPQAHASAETQWQTKTQLKSQSKSQSKSRIQIQTELPTPHSPTQAAESAGDTAGLPVYVYFHGGGWTSGDKSTVTKYCAHQAATGMVVVNVNYRTAGRFQMNHMVEDAEAAVNWVHEHIREFGGDPARVVLGGDSAGGHIAALFTATSSNPELREHFGMTAAPRFGSIQGLVLHCSAVDLSMLFDPAPILSKNFIRLLHPKGRGVPAASRSLRASAKYLSPIEWVKSDHPEVFVSTSERDYFYDSNLQFINRLRAALVPVETLIYGHENRNTRHTWQQNYRFAESQTVYERLTAFIQRVTAPISAPLMAPGVAVGS
ncbi:MAG: alpha/beta hydrolase [Subtercola sp.]|nr:alpha/beta hydrolase [Subtercola sp.]